MASARVLFIDDEEDFVEIVATRLRSRDVAVDTAFNGPDGIAKAKENTYDAVLLDLSMPGMDGMETMKHLLGAKPNLQIIILTGQGSVSAGVDAIKQGAVDFVEKPADIDQLMSKLTDAQEKRIELFEEDVSRKMDDLMRKKGW
ncbi:response regulator [candidate division GN15 bacterium]|nr:response regulator [candidate division GN15 bacterium]